MAYADYHDTMKITEDMVSKLVMEINGSYIVKIHPNGVEKTLDFTPPFKRIPMIKGLEERTKEKFPEDLTTDEANKFL